MIFNLLKNNNFNHTIFINEYYTLFIYKTDDNIKNLL